MNITGKLGFAIMVLGIGLISCADTKKKDHPKGSEVSKEKIEHKEDAEVKDHGYETAMATYQCPMKCEGDKSYKEEGACPVCKMDLKMIEAEHTGEDDIESETKEESSE